MSVENEFRDFVAARASSLRRTAYLLTGDQGHADDLVQTALTKVYLSSERIRDAHAAEAYARRTLVTTYTSWRRRRSWQERPAERLGERDQPDHTDALIDRADLRTSCAHSYASSGRSSSCGSTKISPRPQPPRQHRRAGGHPARRGLGS